jgi:hypothetical protein
LEGRASEYHNAGQVARVTAMSFAIVALVGGSLAVALLALIAFLLFRRHD